MGAGEGTKETDVKGASHLERKLGTSLFKSISVFSILPFLSLSLKFRAWQVASKV